MKINELRERENYDENLMKTMRHCIQADKALGVRYTTPVQWYCHPFFSVYTTKNFCNDGRLFLRNQYLYTPKIMRRWIQAAAVEIMYQKKIYQQALKPAFEIEAPENADDIMWMPGNQRFRKFDFSQRTVRIYTKNGFSAEGILKEIDFRNQNARTRSWIIPVLKYDNANGVVEEPLLAAHPVNREFDEKRVRAAFDKALAALDELHTLAHQSIAVDEYIDIKRAEFADAKSRIMNKFHGICLDNVDAVFDKSVSVIRRVKQVDISLTHGDFQPGNILIPDENRDDVWLIDWEDLGVRASIYDMMTCLLQSRSPFGLKKRVRSFLRFPERCTVPLKIMPGIAVALWAIEEWIWLLQVSSRDGIDYLPAGLCQHFKEIS